jgi:hypothetical protein
MMKVSDLLDDFKRALLSLFELMNKTHVVELPLDIVSEGKVDGISSSIFNLYILIRGFLNRWFLESFNVISKGH